MKLSVPKSHHYVPKTYLSRFADPEGFLRVLDHERGQMRRQRPKEVMRIDAYYRQVWAPSGVDPNILEERLAAGIESDIKAVLDCLCETPDRLSSDQASILAYMELQRVRVPRQAGWASGMILTSPQQRHIHSPYVTPSAMCRASVCEG